MTEIYSRKHPKPAGDWVYFSVHRFLNALVWLLIRPEITGREHVPAHGAYLFTTNHMSFFDSILVFCIVPHRMVAFGADKWRRAVGLRQFCEMLGIIWVARGEADAEAIKATLGVLKRGGAMGLAPEGTRNKLGTLQPGKPGAAYLADRAKVPIVPCGMAGTETVIKSWKSLRRPRVRVVIGPNYMLAGSGRAKGPQLEVFTEEIMCRIAALLPAKYRGVYAEHPLLARFLAAEGAAAPAGSGR